MLRSSPGRAGEEPEFVGSLRSTRDNGEFRFQGTRPAGRYELLALTQRGPVSLLDGQIIDFDPQQPLTNLTFHLAPMKNGRWRSFGTAEGLPDNRVLCLLPEADGTTWVGTSSGGLARFDGQEFVPWNAPASLREASVFNVRRDPQGVLWACTSRGVARFDGPEWTLRYTPKDGLPGNSRAFVPAWDAAGTMWVGTWSGLFRREGERFVQVLSAVGKSMGEIDDLLVETNGTMWVASFDRGPLRWDGKEMRPLPAASGVDASRSEKVYRDGEGQIWFSTRGSGVVQWDAASTNLVDARIRGAGMAMHRDSQGTWWTGGGSGLKRRTAGSSVNYRKADGLASDQVQTIAPDQNGTLWVTITKRLAEMMGGIIAVESEPGQGSTFRFTFPNVAITELAEADAVATGGEGDFTQFAPATILAADDVARNRALLAGYFEGTGHKLITATNGLQVLELAEKHRPEVILMDMRMPDMDGYEATKRLKANAALHHITVIAVTASSFREEEARARKICDGFIRKPFNRAELIAELKRFLKPGQSDGPTKVAEAAAVVGTGPEPEMAVPADALAKRPGLLAKLDQQQQSVWPDLCQSLAMDEVEQFARRLRDWAGEGHWPTLRRYAAELEEQVQQFDLVRLPKTLERFPEIRERLT